MARILGLDLGSYSLKAVMLETNLRGFAVKQVTEVRLPTEGERVDRLKNGLAQLSAQGWFQVDTIAVAMPGLSLATHAITMPFTDTKKIEATIGFEVEGQLPFDLSEVIFDYQLSSSDEKGANVVVGVVRKEELASVLATLKESKFDPRVVTHPALVFQNVVGTLPPALMPENAEDAYAIVDLGHERVNVAILSPNGAVELARTFSGGGAALTKALAAEFQIDLVQADEWKRQHGAIGNQVIGEDAQRASMAFSRGFGPVLRELKTTMKSYTARSRRQVGSLILCGGTANLRGLAEQLARDLGMPVHLMQTPDELTAASAETGPFTRTSLGVGAARASDWLEGAEVQPP